MKPNLLIFTDIVMKSEKKYDVLIPIM